MIEGVGLVDDEQQVINIIDTLGRGLDWHRGLEELDRA
jgi:hypothetical protein